MSAISAVDGFHVKISGGYLGSMHCARMKSHRKFWLTCLIEAIRGHLSGDQRPYRTTRQAEIWKKMGVRLRTTLFILVCAYAADHKKDSGQKILLPVEAVKTRFVEMVHSSNSKTDHKYYFPGSFSTKLSKIMLLLQEWWCDHRLLSRPWILKFHHIVAWWWLVWWETIS